MKNKEITTKAVVKEFSVVEDIRPEMATVKTFKVVGTPGPESEFMIKSPDDFKWYMKPFIDDLDSGVTAIIALYMTSGKPIAGRVECLGDSKETQVNSQNIIRNAILLSANEVIVGACRRAKVTGLNSDTGTMRQAISETFQRINIRLVDFVNIYKDEFSAESTYNGADFKPLQQYKREC